MPGAAGVVDMDVVPGDAGPQQGVGLVVGVLLGGGDPRVPDQHLSTKPRPWVIDVVSRRELPTVTTCIDAHRSRSVENEG
jgi:hypothetical protein